MESAFVTSGVLFSGTSFRSIGQVIMDLIDETEKELLIVSYTFSDSDSRIFDHLNSAVKRALKIDFLLDRRSLVLGNALDRFDNELGIKPHYFEDLGIGKLHAKVIISDRRKAFIGSSNITIGGTLLNHEIGVITEGREVWILADLIYSVIHSLRHLDVE